MQCISTPLSEDQLIAMMSGVAEDTVVEHLQQCAFCQNQLDRLKRAEDRLREKLHRWDCPDETTLGEFALKILSEAEQDRIAKHVKTCPLCRQDLADLQGFMDGVDRAEAQERDKIAHNRRPPALANRPKRPFVPAMSVAVMHGAAMRGDGPQSFEVEGLRLVVSVTHEEGYYELNGQLLGPNTQHWSNGLVKAEQGEAWPVLGIVNHRGKFQCRLPTAMDTHLTITAQDGTTIRVEGIKVAPE